MTAPTFFTVIADYKSVVVDLASDVDADPQLGPITAKVTFTPVLANGDVILATNASPRPTGYLAAGIVARIDTDGRLKLRVDPDGDIDIFANTAAFPATGLAAKVYFSIANQTYYRWTGSAYAETYPYAAVRLLANTALLGLDDLYYRVSFSEVVFNGASGYIAPFVFEAPSTDVELNLIEVTPVPGQQAIAITKGDKGDQGYSFVGLAPAGDGSSVVGLIETEQGIVPAGEPIPISLAYNSTVTHTEVAETPRPPVNVAVIWIGSVQPTYAIDGDVWLDTSGTAPTIVSTVLNGLNLGLALNQDLVATGSTPIVWSLHAGTVPAGLVVSDGGNVSGTPTATGAYSFTLKALNGFGDDTQVYSGSVGSTVAPTINTASIDPITAGVAVSTALSVTGSVTITFAVHAGTLPTGLALNATTGVVSGAPTATGAYSFTIRATNDVGFDDQVFTGTVIGVAPTITTSALASPFRNFAFTSQVSVIGTSPITFALQSGSLPAGLALNAASGVISGTPTVVASSSFTIRASNSFGFDDQALTVAVLESTPSIVQTSLNVIAVGAAFSQTLTVTTGGPTITWSVLSGTLPAGIALNTGTGTLVGTASTVGAYSFTVRATNGTQSDDQLFTGSTVSAVAFDVIGTGGMGSTVTTTAVSGTHTAAAGATVLVYLQYVSTTNSASLAAVTHDGTAMTQVGSTISVGSTTYAGTTYYQFAMLFRRIGVASGVRTITATRSAAATLQFESISYSGVATIGSLQTVTTSSLTVSQTATSATGRVISQAFIKPGVYAGATAYNRQVRVNKASGNPFRTLCVGEAAGAATVTFSATVASGDPNVSVGLAVDLAG